jgi:hypothetical protein
LAYGNAVVTKILRFLAGAAGVVLSAVIDEFAGRCGSTEKGKTLEKTRE